MPSDDIAISVRSLTKSYRLFGHPGDRIKQFFSLGLKQYHREFTALKDVSFDIKKGETVGIIGRNGSGKSTLLQLICGILKPTSGTVQVNGRVSALLELGAGFNPEFTGRENVYFQGALMGFTERQMDERFEAIASFADIGEFIDQPVRTYSSGMFVRLAFSVATHTEPEILIIDEALAVGDPSFQKRCYARIKQMMARGLTLVLVSHDNELIRNLTDRALLLDKGSMQYWGETREAIHHYRKVLCESEFLQTGTHAPSPSPLINGGSGYGSGGARIVGLHITGSDGQPRTVFHPGERMNFAMGVAIDTPVDHLNIAIVIRTLEGWKIYSWGTLNQDIAIWSGRADGEVFWDRAFPAGDNIDITLSLTCNLGTGTYEVQAVVTRELDKWYGEQQILNWQDEAGVFRVEMNSRDYFFGGLCDLHGKASLHG
jgi:lipopolysaccharide transport system ATP-binding protein